MAHHRPLSSITTDQGPPAAHPLMSIAEAARMLGYSEMTIRRAIDDKRFPAVKLGRKALVPRAFIENLLAAVAAGQTVVIEDLVPTTPGLPAQRGAVT